MRGQIEDMTTAPHLVARDGAGMVLTERRWPADVTPSFALVMDMLLALAEDHLDRSGLVAVGHRVVHGGADHIAPELVTPAMLALLESLIPLDPLHMPFALAPMHGVAVARPKLPQVACFDTAFHHTLSPIATRFAVPRAISATGVRRYGFHGLSYEYIAGRLKTVAPSLGSGRVIAAHLGSGASLCALNNGVSVETTTGFSALEGLVMATRCGSIDPGVIFYLGHQGQSLGEIEDIFYHHSGLLGVSGISGDVRVLLASADPHAKEALDLFIYRIALDVGALVSALGGLDGIVFTAGIGEHAPAVRAAVCDRLAWLGIRLDAAANDANAACISTPDSKIDIRVIATDEEAMIAAHTQALIDPLSALAPN